MHSPTIDSIYKSSCSFVSVISSGAERTAKNVARFVQRHPILTVGAFIVVSIGLCAAEETISFPNQEALSSCLASSPTHWTNFGNHRWWYAGKFGGQTLSITEFDQKVTSWANRQIAAFIDKYHFPVSFPAVRGLVRSALMNCQSK